MKKLLFCVAAILLLATALLLPTSCEAPAQKAPAQFETVSLDINPSEVTVGQQVSASVKVTNTGGSEGTYTAILKIDDVEIERKPVGVSPEATVTITFTFARDLPGNYNIEIGGLSRSLAVKELTKPELTKPELIGVAEGKVYTGSVTIRVMAVPGVSYTATIDGNPYRFQTPYSEKGEHTLKVTATRESDGSTSQAITNFTVIPDDETLKIESDPTKGFYWAYYLYVPGSIWIADREDGKTYLLVEPNNTGSTSDDQEVHDKAAQKLAEGRRLVAEGLGVPLLVPTFPRPDKYWQIYTQALDRDTILTEIDGLKRIDLQLISMIDDAIERLSLEGINLEKEVLMMGFSASGMFVNRFTLLHPERVQAAAVGSPGGWPIAPLEEWDGVNLRYPIGVWDIEELVGEEFDIESLKSVPVYFYLGDEDTNDSVPYRDSYEQEDEQLIFQYFGDTPVERWPIAEEMCNSAGCSSQFVLYPGVEHLVTSAMLRDIETFFLENL